MGKYGDDGFKKEIELLQNAEVSEEGEVILRKYLQSLVETVAQKYSDGSVSLLEFTAAGWRGVEKAKHHYLEKVNSGFFENTEPFKFSTYATWWIRNSVTAYKNTKNNIRPEDRSF